MQIKPLYWIGLVLFCTVSFSSCIDVPSEFNFDKWNPEIAIPLLQTSVTIEDFLEETEAGEYLTTDSFQFLSLVYEEEIFASTAEEFIDIPDFNLNVSSPSEIYEVDEFPFDFRLDFLSFKEGTLVFDIVSQFEEDVTLKLDIPNLKLNGQSYSQELILDYTGTVPFTTTGQIDLTGYSINFVDEFRIEYYATSPSGDSLVLQDVNYLFSAVKFKYVEGSFESVTFGVDQDSFPIDLVDIPVIENFELEDPRVTLTVKNSVGVPMTAKAILFDAYTEDGERIPFESELSTGISLDYPTLEEHGKSKTTEFVIHKDNSNIVDIVKAKPTRFDYQLEGTLFPEEGNFKGFAFDTSGVEANLLLEVPLWGSVKELEVEEITDLDTENFDQAKSLELKILATNGFPVDAFLQIYFEDDNGNIIEQLVEDGEELKLLSAMTSNGRVTSPTTTEFVIEISEDKLTAITTATKIRLEANVSTPNNGNEPVQFFSDYNLDIKVGAKVKI